MLCSIYKSSKKEGTYLYIPKKDDFSQVPDNAHEDVRKTNICDGDKVGWT